MFKKLFVLASYGFFAFIASPVAAQDGAFDIDVGIKTAIFFYNQEEGVKLTVEHGWSLGGEVILWFANGFGVGGEIEYYTMSESLDIFPGVEIDAAFSQMPICINAYYRFDSGGTMVPFIGGGLAFVNNKVSTSSSIAGMDLDVSLEDTFTGFTFFGGLQFGRFYIEAQWLQVDADLGVEQYLGDIGHSEASGLSFWAGIRF